MSRISMIIASLAFISLSSNIDLVNGFSGSLCNLSGKFCFSSSVSSWSLHSVIDHNSNDEEESRECMVKSSSHSRREMIACTVSKTIGFASLVSTLQSQPSLAAEGGEEGKNIVMFKSKSGLEYRELVEGTGPSPKYGQLVSFSYKGYVSLAGDPVDKKPAQFDEVKSYLTKHGNGLLIPGLDEGLHSMKVGGKRRLYIPPKLGFVGAGSGPIPEGWWSRRVLNGLLDDMVERQGGRLIYDVELLAVREDEADQGYYDDDSISPDDFNTLRANMQGSRASDDNSAL